ncbi:MAG TPA: hypothetical protein VN969_06585 [Streptosporangiaceae bacterium]|jgi:hypothetical protein|nr:hypothetical protein [Streptosporangiaceae bacterium]
MSVPASPAGDTHPHSCIDEDEFEFRLEILADLFFGTAELISRLEVLLEQIRLAPQIS